MEIPHAAELAGRFAYWRGRSGRRYIHTVYALGECPPLPGGVYVAVARDAFGRRRAVAAGRLSPLWDLAASVPAGCEEVHVHLLAGTDAEAQAAAEDLRAALGLGATVAARAAATPEPLAA